MPFINLSFLDVYARMCFGLVQLMQVRAGACIIKLITAVSYHNKLECFTNVRRFHPSLAFAGKGGAHPWGAPYKTQL
jgi:hypothetical protein